MTVRTARALFIASVALLCIVATWAFSASGDERVDLLGDAVRSDTVPGSGGSAIGEAWLPLGGRAVGPAGRPQRPAAEAPAVEPDRAAGSATTTTAVPPAPGVPTALYIPAIEVAAPVVPTGLEEDRSMEVPPVDQAGWYRHGPLPGGAVGSAVIAAHIDYEGEPGVFRRLAELQVGEQITVADDLGMAHVFEVSERYQVDKGELPAGELFRRGGPPVLTLVTCGGGFERSERRYTDNIVVRATPVG
jgi:LPXTG-site transpeptidase (sortase) family protein